VRCRDEVSDDLVELVLGHQVQRRHRQAEELSVPTPRCRAASRASARTRRTCDAGKSGCLCHDRYCDVGALAHEPRDRAATAKHFVVRMRGYDQEFGHVVDVPEARCDFQVERRRVHGFDFGQSKQPVAGLHDRLAVATLDDRTRQRRGIRTIGRLGPPDDEFLVVVVGECAGIRVADGADER